jgi:hypothetical protein
MATRGWQFPLLPFQLYVVKLAARLTLSNCFKEHVMKKFISVSLFVVSLALGALSFSSSANAEELKMVGTVTKIELAADGKSAIAVLKDSKTGESVTIQVTDELTLDKFKDKRIVVDDEIRCRFEKEGDKNSSKVFKKTAGC